MAFKRTEATKSGEPRWAIYWLDSERKQRKRTFRDPKEADRFLKLKEADALRGTPEPSRTKFAAMWDRWLEESAPRLTPKVRRTYLSMGDRLLLPYFGKMPLADMNRQLIPRWIAWANGQAAPETVRKAFVVLSSVMGYAMDMDLVPANPCSRMGKYLPTTNKKRVRPHLTTEQVKQLAAAMDSTFRAMILSMAVLGLRPGEAIALRVGDLDLDAGVLHVGRSAVDVGTEMVERNTTKTSRSRTIPLMGTEGEFKKHLRWEYRPLDGVGPQRTPDPDDRLFTSRFTSGDVIKTAALAKMVKRAGERIGVKGLSADDLRHVASANVIEMTGDPSFAQYLLGHTSPVMTLSKYDQGTPARWERAIKAVKEAYKD